MSSILKKHVPLKELEERALAAVRGQLGCHGTLTVTIKRFEEPDLVGRSWGLATISPPIEDHDSSFRAFQAVSALADQYDLEE